MQHFITARAEPDPYNRLVLLDGSRTVETVQETLEGPRNARRKVVTAVLATKNEGGSVNRRPIDISWLAAASEVYKISASLKDYVFVSVPIVTADFPNRNMDCFSLKEISRFSPTYGRPVYMSFIGKPCLTGDTLVPTDVGLVRLDQLQASGAKYTLAQEGTTKIENWWNRGTKPTVKVNGEHGYSVTATHDHEVRVLRDGLNYEWVEAGDLKPGDYMVVRSGLMHNKRLDLKSYHPKMRKNKFRNAFSHDLPTHMTPELARILGYLVAEGSVTESRVDFFNTDPEILQDYHDCWVATFGHEPNRHQTAEAGDEYCIRGIKGTITKPCYTLWSARKEIVAFLHNLGLKAATASTKSIPESILIGDRVAAMNFLAAYVEGDGCHAKKKAAILCYSVSERLAGQLQVLWNGLGFDSTKAFSPESDTHNGGWWVRLNGIPAINFIREMPPITAGGTDVVAEWEEYEATRFRMRAEHGGGIPFVREFIRSFIRDRWVKTASKTRQYITDNGDIVTAPINFGQCVDGVAHNLPVRKASECLQGLEKVSEIAYERLASVMGPYRFEQVESVEDAGLQEVFDIQTSAGHFIANGLVVHNCHKDHDNQDPTKARGAHFDSTLRQYDVYPGKAGYKAEHTQMRKLWKVRVLTGWCRQKDPKLVDSIMKRERTGYSMGAYLDYALCSVPYCGKVTTGKNMCEHKGKKGKLTRDGYIIYDLIQGTSFFETSSVEDPADIDAFAPDDVVAPHLKWDADDIWATGLEGL